MTIFILLAFQAIVFSPLSVYAIGPEGERPPEEGPVEPGEPRKEPVEPPRKEPTEPAQEQKPPEDIIEGVISELEKGNIAPLRDLDGETLVLMKPEKLSRIYSILGERLETLRTANIQQKRAVVELAKTVLKLPVKAITGSIAILMAVLMAANNLMSRETDIDQSFLKDIVSTNQALEERIYSLFRSKTAAVSPTERAKQIAEAQKDIESIRKKMFDIGNKAAEEGNSELVESISSVQETFTDAALAAMAIPGVPAEITRPRFEIIRPRKELLSVYEMAQKDPDYRSKSPRAKTLATARLSKDLAEAIALYSDAAKATPDNIRMLALRMTDAAGKSIRRDVALFRKSTPLEAQEVLNVFNASTDPSEIAKETGMDITKAEKVSKALNEIAQVTDHEKTLPLYQSVEGYNTDVIRDASTELMQYIEAVKERQVKFYREKMKTVPHEDRLVLAEQIKLLETASNTLREILARPWL